MIKWNHTKSYGRSLGGSQSQSGHGGEEKNSEPLPGLERRNIQTVAQFYTDWIYKSIVARTNPL
jgi:hypothetical protein